MREKIHRAIFLFVIAAGLLFWQVYAPCYASEIVPNPDEAVNEHIREFLSKINEEGKQFLFPDEADEINLDNVIIGKGYKTYSFKNGKLTDTGFVDYPIYSNGKLFALYMTGYDKDGSKLSDQFSSIEDRAYYGEDIDYSDITIVTDFYSHDWYVISGSYIWHYEHTTLIEKTSRDEIKDSNEALINSLVTQGKISEPEEDTLFDRIYMFGRWCVGGLIQGACAS
ncbi:hypothetical protein [Lancefieldella rimae]|jgi:hypothetical protein|uniref:hypothetical protein n=1 Tax=Lancefieldella rimae TaxID=1383 RepID=UPI0028EDD88D|nr:hypothetical protein [Lancefieldella rimae]